MICKFRFWVRSGSLMEMFDVNNLISLCILYLFSLECIWFVNDKTQSYLLSPKFHRNRNLTIMKISHSAQILLNPSYDFWLWDDLHMLLNLKCIIRKTRLACYEQSSLVEIWASKHKVIHILNCFFFNVTDGRTDAKMVSSVVSIYLYWARN